MVLAPDAPRFTIVAVTAAFARATRKQRADLLGQGLFEAFPDNPDDPAASGASNVRASLDRVIRYRVSDVLAMQRHDIRGPDAADGAFEERWWHPQNTPVLGPDGAIDYLIHTVHDVTEQVRTKDGRRAQDDWTEELQVQAERLETEAFLQRQETLEANAQLRLANAEVTRLYERARELDALKSQFFTSLSHELRTPLTLILGPTQRLLDSPATPEPVTRDLGVVARNARTLLRHVDDLLDVAKLEARKMPMEYVESDLARLVRFVAGHFDVLATEKRITFAIETPEALGAAVDPAKVRRVLFNLLSNAFKFTPDGGRVRIVARPQGDAQAVIAVADSGPGIPAEQRELLFERFRQLEGAAARRSDGTGLGLSIVRDLVSLHGGTVAIGDAPEGGALFTVELPRRAPAEFAVASGEAPSEADAARPALAYAVDDLRRHPAARPATPPAADGPLVLVVEDNPEMNRFIAETLMDDFRVATAFDGREGLAQAVALRPDLILADIMMPGMSGDELVREVRKCAELAATPIVMLTAKAEAELLPRVLREGAQDYLTKPFAVEEMRVRVANLVAKKRAEDALRFAEARSQGIVAISADAIISVDELLRITMFNEGAQKTFGYAPQEVLGTPIDLLIPERFRGALRQLVERFVAGRESGRPLRRRGPSLVGRRKNGEEFPLEGAISKLDVAGRRLLTVTLRDISARVRSDKGQRFLTAVGSVLASSLEYEDTLMSVARLAVRDLADVCLVDILEDRGEARWLKAVSRDPAHAAACEVLLGQSRDRDRPGPITAVIESRRPAMFEAPPLAAYFSDGEAADTLPLLGLRSIMAVPLLSRGKVLGVIVLVSCSAARVYDPSDLRLAEALAQRAALSIQNARLYRQAQRAVQTRQDVLGIVAHDLRNPLGHIMMAAVLLRRGSEPGSPSRELTGMIEGAATRMNRIIQDLLDVTRMEAGHLSIEATSISPGPMLASLVEAQRPQAVAASLELRLELAPALPEVWADRDRLLQVFDNLIGNAIKFTSQGGLITVGAVLEAGRVLFWVADNGVGIAKVDAAHVFDRFWQARKADRRGAGLGLPVVKGIVEAHRGSVWVESTPGEGSTFFFTIPLARALGGVVGPSVHGADGLVPVG